MNNLQFTRLEKRFMDEIQALKDTIGSGSPAPAAVAAPAPSVELLKEMDAMRASISKTAMTASDSAQEISNLKQIIAQLAAKIDNIATQIVNHSAQETSNMKQVIAQLAAKIEEVACKCAASADAPSE